LRKSYSVVFQRAADAAHRHRRQLAIRHPFVEHATRVESAVHVHQIDPMAAHPQSLRDKFGDLALLAFRRPSWNGITAPRRGRAAG